jgi:signal transduction histidine kinase/DNA-binding response OmpR family regulator/HAMP domain-containing protein
MSADAVVPETMTEPLPPAAAIPPRRRGRRGRRIAEKLFLSYVLPLAVLLVAGFVFPFFLWSYLGQPIEEYNDRVRFTDGVATLYRASMNSSSQARGIVLYRDPAFEQQFGDLRNAFSANYRELYEYADARGETRLKARLETANRTWHHWFQQYVRPEIQHLRGVPNAPPLVGQPLVRSSRMRVGYVSVKTALDNLVLEANAYRDKQEYRARFAEIMRRITSILIPVVAVLLAVLIGRAIALGITRPLEALTTAALELEKGNAAALLMAEQAATGHADDEIGELQHAFTSMARTIGQREAMLRAQNEAQGALTQRITAVLDATTDGIVLLDRASAFSVVNRRFSELFGLESDVLLYQMSDQVGPLMFSRFKDRNEARKRFEKLRDDPDAVMDETFDIIEPLPRTLRIFSAPVRSDMDADGSPDLVGRIFVFRDVTAETLADRMKSEFVSTVSHELRTPLTGIKGYVDLMVNGKTGPLNTVQTEFLTMVQGSTVRLSALIDDLLDISRMEAGRMDIRAVSVDYLSLVQEAVHLMQREADERRVGLSVIVQEEGQRVFPPVQGDADRITQVLVNLISNGIKYTPADGAVTIRVAYQDDFVTTQVIDTGIGITKQDQGRLFEKFFRADNSSTRETGGTGLGLAITKAILEKLGGSIWVESETSKGSTFSFTLPLVAADRGRERTAQPPIRDGAGRRLVLSVDRDTAVLHRLGYELRQQGFMTANAATPQDALRRARGLRPDIITLDPLTPGLDGFELLRSLKAATAAKGTPLALVSLRVEDGVTEVRDSRAFLPRSADAAALEACIQALLTVPTGRRAAVVVVGDATLAEIVRESLTMFGDRIHQVSAASPDEADNHAGALFPDLVVLDAAVAPGTVAGEWVAKLQRRRPGAHLPLIVLTDPELLEGNVFSLIPPGSGTLPLGKLGASLNEAMGAREPFAAK